jgi:hypothetical protein
LQLFLKGVIFAEMTHEYVDKKVRGLAAEAGKIIRDYDRLYDITGKRLAFWGMELKKHFDDPANKLVFGVVGYPNTDKTTLAYSCAKILQLYDVSSTYCDLDVYTFSGKAIEGQINWDDRPKQTRDKVGIEIVQQSIEALHKIQKGIVIADFPGMIEDPYQPLRLNAINYAIILAKDEGELEEWINLCSAENTGFRFLFTHKQTETLQLKLFKMDARLPAIASMNRQAIVNVATLSVATGILEEAADMTKAPKSKYHNYFTEAELTALEEILDPLYSISPYI